MDVEGQSWRRVRVLSSQQDITVWNSSEVVSAVYRVSQIRYITTFGRWKKNFVALDCERTLLSELPLLVGEVSANFCG
jgi:hypothetical protein